MAGQSAGETLASGMVHVPENGNGGFPYGYVGRPKVGKVGR